MKKTLILIFTVLVSFSFSSCTIDRLDDDDLIVAVSIVPQEAFVEAVAGDLVEIVTLIPPGYSPGNYEPTTLTMEYLSNAAVYFTIGVPTEDANILPAVEDLNIVNLEEIVALEYDDLTLEAGGRDPHIWLSIKRVKVMVEAIRDTLIEIDPDNEAVYTANTATYLEDLDTANATIEDIFSDVTMNTFIVYHPAFGYLADEYGLELVTLQENGQEATAQHYIDVIEIANELDIEYVFFQAENDSTQVEAFADEIDGTIVELSPLSSDYIDNLIVMANLIREALR